MLHNTLQKIEPVLLRLFHQLRYPSPPNFRGDREVEWSWIVAHLPAGPGRALDFGCGASYLALVAAQRGFRTTAIDLAPVYWFYTHPDLDFIQRDIINLDFTPESFDLIISCSSIEHVGLVGRYGVKENRPDGDIEVMGKMKKLLKPEGGMLLTIPIGQDAVFPPLHRVYGGRRLPRLLDGYTIEEEEYWMKNAGNQWTLTEKSEALDQRPSRDCYALGCFVLQSKMEDRLISKPCGKG